MDTMMLQRHVGDLVGRYRDEGYFPSACVRVFDRDGTLAVCCAGGASPDSLFDVASLTKIATATQVLLLAEEGAWTMDSVLSDLLPQVAQDTYLRGRIGRVTLFQLLTHTSGIPAWYPFYTRRGEGFFEVLRHALTSMPPVSGVVYSDMNFMLLGKVLEQKRGLPLEECLWRFLTVPLGLGKMMYRPPLTVAGLHRMMPSGTISCSGIRGCSLSAVS